MMVGLWEDWGEISQTLDDLRKAFVDIVTIGQYLQPTAKQMPLGRYYTPDEFKALQKVGTARGFLHVESGPMVRISYHAARQARRAFGGEGPQHQRSHDKAQPRKPEGGSGFSHPKRPHPTTKR